MARCGGGAVAGCLCCSLFIALVVVFIVLGVIFSPHAPKAYADSAALSRFDLGAGANGTVTGGGGDLLQYNLTVAIRLRNTHRLGIRYDYAEAQALYDSDRFGFGFHLLQPFSNGGKSDARITATFAGSAVMNDDHARRTYRRENGEGFYYIKVRVRSDLSYKSSGVFARQRGVRSTISCVLRLPAPLAGGNANATAMTTLGTRCDVDFQLPAPDTYYTP
jgi:hypothetical protein